jgi:hypothetical protein
MVSAPPTMTTSMPGPIMPAAAKAAVMLEAQAKVTENEGTVGSSFASSQISRATLLQPRLGMTVPQITRSGRALGS